MNVAEKDRLAFLNAPEKNPAHFEALLPYAIALGVETAWAKQFDTILAAGYAPAWYVNPMHARVTSAFLLSDLSAFKSSANQTLFAAMPQTNSGGGGGSW